MNRAMPTNLLRLLALLPALLLPEPGAAEDLEAAFMRHFYAPDLVMQHQREIHLTTDQRRAITTAVRATQDEVLEIQWQILDAAQSMETAAAGGDEAALVSAAEQVFGYESQIKLSHLRLLVRIKQTLTPVQQARLDAMRPGPKPAPPAE